MNNGGPAFPLPTVFNEMQGLKYTYETGMTLRDYFAGEVLSIIVSDFKYAQCKPDVIASWAYGLADAMLKAREVKNES